MIFGVAIVANQFFCALSDLRQRNSMKIIEQRLIKAGIRPSGSTQITTYTSRKALVSWYQGLMKRSPGTRDCSNHIHKVAIFET